LDGLGVVICDGTDVVSDISSGGRPLVLLEKRSEDGSTLRCILYGVPGYGIVVFDNAVK